ncbi:MAG TPA: glycosyltransferase, partial [Roseiflexaceae bacterium]|nr:glycosyltransferase [Roseiflexaceae bacterium]
MNSQADMQQATHNTLQHVPAHPLTRSPAHPRASLIIVTYNSANLLPACFEALATTQDTSYEVIVVDNASQDGTAALIAEQYPYVRLLANRENVGFGR